MRNYTENGKNKYCSVEYLTREQMMSSRIKGKCGILNDEEDDEILQRYELLAGCHWKQWGMFV